MPISGLQQLPLDAVIVNCDKPNCYLNLTVYTDSAAEELRNHHDCPVAGGQSSYHWEVTMTLVERMWEMIDEEFKELETLKAKGVGSEEYVLLRGKLRGYAEMLALFMSPYFKDANEITREVVKRSKAEADYETPGIGSRRFETPPNEPNKYAVATQHSKPPSPKIAIREQTVPQHNLTDDEMASIKETAVMMPAEHLAAAFGVSVEVIRYVAAH